ncbi:MAG: CopG family transcriptional regulator [Acidobacteria bacterium]|nr:MAG: CopG family transcriptional regulator [Acidobacteriota bacterium]REK09287.1 MAG: CopG family transcriptional regulator [Acidobacteriota bacterium]
MQRTTIRLPSALKVQAQQLAQGLGISLGELVREALQSRLDTTADDLRADDPFFHDRVFEDDGASDLAAAHDDALYT